MSKKSEIYTRGGDKGKTSLIGGRRVHKFHSRIEAYGTVDELMAQTAMLRDMVEDDGIREDLLTILDIQMATASVLAADVDHSPVEFPLVGEEQISFLERRIDEMDATLEPLTSFLIPGGHPIISQVHIARTVCRRTERTILKLGQEVNIQEDMVRFYNRLSDYFFVLSRKIAVMTGVPQQPWKSGL
ncbi:MAG: cob(I)yrinic acid a,c-diamide adenosyltransferase [Bacteroidetes bacterium]|nr:cob(I)yrinic acid a,c-diamide adenosyltransferase [Bacteroidota bacterium]